MFGPSLAEDRVDRLNHTWVVSLFLLLSLITWLLPVHLVKKENPTQASKSSAGSHDPYIAQCWCPRQFTSSHVEYANGVCGQAFNLALKGVKTQFEAKVSVPRDVLFPSEDNPPNVEEIFVNNTTDNRFKETKAKAILAIWIKTPIALLIFALSLKFAHVLWILSFGCGVLNVHEILQSLEKAQLLDRSRRVEIREETVQAIREHGVSKSFLCGLLYIAFKLLVCIIVVIGLLYVNILLLRETRRLASDLSRGSKDVMNTSDVDSLTPMPLDSKNTTVWMCDFRIQQFSNYHHYTIQCVLLPNPKYVSREEGSLLFGKGKWAIQKTLTLLESLYTSVQALLITLAIINVFSLLMWISKLFCGVVRSEGRSQLGLSLDGRFLVEMAQINVSRAVARYLKNELIRGSEGRGNSDDKMDVQLHDD